MRESQKINADTRIENRNAIMAALAKAQGETFPPNISLEDPDGPGNAYYTLTKEELTALLSGNMEKIESWVGNLDRRQATWLLRRLIKENV
jgi:hypothetical protein